MYLPSWLYELKPLAYAAVATVGLSHASAQPLGWCSAGLLWIAALCMLYMRVRFRQEHRGRYWHPKERRGTADRMARRLHSEDRDDVVNAGD